MGDRFYESQKGSNRAAAKPKRKLKSDYVSEIGVHLGTDLSGLVKTDLKTLEKLHECVLGMVYA